MIHKNYYFLIKHLLIVLYKTDCVFSVRYERKF